MASSRLFALVCMGVWGASAEAAAGALHVDEPTMGTPALSMVTDGGAPLALVAVKAHTVLEGSWVTTELDLVFRDHPAPSRFRVALPPRSRVLMFDARTGEGQSALTPGEGNSQFADIRAFGGHVSLTYTHEVRGAHAVLVPLAGHHTVQHLLVEVTDQDGKPLADPLEEHGGAVGGDVSLAIAPSDQAFRAEDLAIVPVRVPEGGEPRPLEDVVLLVDSSASAASDWGRTMDAVRDLLSKVSGQLALVAFDQEVARLFVGRREKLDSSVIERLAARGALGATDLGQAFNQVKSIAQLGSFRRVVLVSDGIATHGKSRRSALVGLVSGWAKTGIRRLDVVAPSALRDDELLTALVTSDLPERGVVTDMTDRALARLQLSTVADLEVSVLGATAQAPRILRGLQPGDMAWVYARVPKEKTLRVKVGTAPAKMIPSRPAWYPLFERVFPTVGIGVPSTLEPGVLRKKFEILNGKMTITKLHTRPPTLRCGDPTYVSGRLPPESIQRIIRMNFGRFRGCYASRVPSGAAMDGRVVVRFVIGRDGQVNSVIDQGSTLENHEVTRCIMEAFTKLKFPLPPGGDVTVVYPLVLNRDGKPTGESPEGPPPDFQPVALTNPEYPLVPRDVGTEGYEGPFATVRQAIRDLRLTEAEGMAREFAANWPSDALPFLAIGEVAEAQGDLARARRAYGSLIELFPMDARQRRIAASWLERVSDPLAKSLALDCLETALTLSPGEVLTQRQLAWMWVRRGQYQKALGLLTSAVLGLREADGEFLRTLLRQDVGMVARALLGQPGVRYATVVEQLKRTGTQLPSEDVLRFVLLDESQNQLALAVYANPERGRFEGTRLGGYPAAGFLVLPSERRTPYTIRVRTSDASFRETGSAVGRGHVELVEHDGKGRLRVETRPFVIMVDPSEVDLGTYGN